jgi:hypothetical protein
MKKWMISIKAVVVCFLVLLSVSCGNRVGGPPQISGVQGPLLNLVDGKVLMTIKLLNLSTDGFKAPIPETRNSSFELAHNIEDGGMMLVFHLDVEDLRSIDVDVGDGNYLPDGRPVPGVPGGRLENSLRIDTPWNDISFFYHQKLFGIWIPFGFETAGLSGYWNMHFNNRNIGMLGLVGNDPVNGHKAGAIVFLRLTNLNDKQFNRLLKLTKRNPHLIH